MRGNTSDTLVILVVEDDWLLRYEIATYLREAGCLVLEAETGERALALLRDEHTIDLVFTDIRLNGNLTGWDVGEASRLVRGDMPVIYASGSAISPTRQVASSLFFNKPYHPAAILHACRSLAETERWSRQA